MTKFARCTPGYEPAGADKSWDQNPFDW
eukprot:SAG25_NODE_9278_length_380_cov_0.548043_2_plen_27_part_01